MTQSQTHTAFHAAHTSAALYRVPGAGCVRIAGADRADFIQRQTTNDVRLLAPNHAITTVLTTGTARILDVWQLVGAPGAEAIDAITLPGRAADTLRYLQKRIFFKDQVTVTDRSAQIAQVAVFGPTSGALLGDVCGVPVPPPGAISTVDSGAGPVQVIGADGMIGQGWLVWGTPEAVNALAGNLETAGAVDLDSGTYDVLRVEAGLPAADRELTGEYTPLEAALDRAVSGTKGCYSGQEVLARQITYDKIARRLIGLRLDAPTVSGAPVQVAGHTAGAITSAAVSPRLGPIALAILRRPHFEPGLAVTVATDMGLIAGRTAALPFAD